MVSQGASWPVVVISLPASFIAKRSERRDQDGPNEPEEPDHPISLRDSLSLSTG